MKPIEARPVAIRRKGEGRRAKGAQSAPDALLPTPFGRFLRARAHTRFPGADRLGPVILALVVLVAGCQPALELSDDAVSLPAVQRDPAEGAASPSRWPSWRGVASAGIAASGSPAVHFSTSEGVRWKTAVPGRGNSSPVAWDDLVFLTSALEDSQPPRLVVLCYDRRDGQLRWQIEAGTAHGRTHVKNGYASASVAADGQRVFAFFGSAGLFCFDYSGKQCWHAELGDLDHQWGTASSPVLYGDTVIQLCDCLRESHIAAFDKATGRRRWRTPRPSYSCWSTPVLTTVKAGGQERAELIVNGTGAASSDNCLVLAYDPADGRELWRVRGTTELVTPTPLIGRGLVYSTSGRNGPIMAIRPGGSGDVTDSHVVWRAPRGGPYIPTGVVYRNRLYLITDRGQMTCYDAGNGSEIWSKRFRNAFSASLIAADGRIYATSESGTVYVVAASDAYELLAENQLQSRCLATPAVVDGDLLVRTENELLCIAGKADVGPPAIDFGDDSAALVGRYAQGPVLVEATSRGGAVHGETGNPSTPGSVGNAAVRDASDAVGPGSGGTPDSASSDPQSPPKATADAWPLFRGDPQATGVSPGTLPEQLKTLWTYSGQKDGFEATAAIADGAVYIGSTGGKLYAFALADGKKLWDFNTPLGFTASASVRNKRVYVGDTDGVFYSIDATTGQVKWRYQTDAEINSGANFFQENVLVGSQDGKLYCLKADTGALVWKFESRDQIRCFPTIMGERGFVAGCDARLHVIDLKQGKEIGDVPLESPTGSTPAVMDDKVFVGTEGNVFYAIVPQQSKVLWSYTNAERPMPFRSSAAVTPQAVIVGSRDKVVYALEPKTGKVLWTFSTRQRVDGSPVVVGQRVYIGSADGRLYGLDLKTGRQQWQFEAGGSIVASPAVAQGRLVIGTEEGDLYCLGSK